MMFSQCGPQRFISTNDAYDYLPTYFEEGGIKKVLFLHGEKSWAAAKPYMPEMPASVAIIDVPFNGECSYEEIARVKEIATENQVDMVIGLGGGKCLDTVKSVTQGTNFKLGLIPTLASNCAPWSALSVHYHENGEHINHEIYHETADIMLLNPQVIVNSPINYFVAGIGDTLAKYYESEMIFENMQPEQFNTQLTISRAMAQACRDDLLENSEQAIADMKKGEVTPVFRKVVETVIVTSGLVGGWGDYFARATGAHSVHDALTVFPETSDSLHGERVAYGILVLLALEKREDEMAELLPLYRSMGLPVCLADLNLDGSDQDVVVQIAHDTSADGTQIHFLPIDTGEQAVARAITRVEEITASETAA